MESVKFRICNDFKDILLKVCEKGFFEREDIAHLLECEDCKERILTILDEVKISPALKILFNNFLKTYRGN